MNTAKNIFKYIIYTGLFSLLLTPFITTPSLIFPFVTGKAFFFRIIVEIIFFAWLSLAIIDREYRPKKSWLLYSMFAFLITIFISNYFGVNPELSFWSNFERMEGYITLLHLFALFLVSGSVLNSANWKMLFNCYVASTFFMMLSVAQQMRIDGWDTRVDTSLGNSTYLGIYMLIGAFVSLYLLGNKIYYRDEFGIREKLKSFSVWFYFIAFILQSLIVFQTGTRGSMIGWMIGIVFSSLLIILFLKKSVATKRVFIGIFIFLVLLMSSIFYFKDSDFVKDIPALKRLTTININEGTAQARILNWQIATEGVKEKPFFGWGQSNYNVVFDKYYLPELHGNEPWFDRTHNIIFDWLIAGGIFGLLAYLSIWFGCLYLLWRSSKINFVEKSILTGLLISYFIHNLFVFDNLISYILFIFILAYVHSENSSDIDLLQISTSEYFKTALICVFSIAAPLFVYFLNVDSYFAAKELTEATKIIEILDLSDEAFDAGKADPEGKNIQQRIAVLEKSLDLFKKSLSRNTFGNAEIRRRIITDTSRLLKLKNITIGPEFDNIKNQFATISIEEMKKQIALTPDNSMYKYMLGVFLINIGQGDEGEKYLLQSIDLSNKKQILRIPLIKMYLQTRQVEKSFNLAKETYELDKSKDDIWIEYLKTAVVYDKNIFNLLLNEAIEQKHFSKVEEFLIKMIELNPKNPQSYISLSAFYYRIGESEKSLEIIDSTVAKLPEYKVQLLQIKNDIVAGKIK